MSMAAADAADVSGNTNVELKGEGVHVYSVVGGGLVDEDEGAANVGKNTNITISGGAWAGDTEVSSSQPDKIAVAGGGHILSNDPSMIGAILILKPRRPTLAARYILL